MRNNRLLIAFLVALITLICSQAFGRHLSDRVETIHRPLPMQQEGNGSQQPQEDMEPDASPADKNKREKKQTEASDPFKPFTPSEKIEADQAVDFPYDI